MARSFARVIVASAVLVALLAGVVTRAAAFPGVCVGKDGEQRLVHATSIVVMRHAEYSIITVMADYDGPSAPFAFLIPVPADVRAADVRTVKREMVERLEALSAPRFHTFYEQDPCDPAPLEQRWDEQFHAHGRGFLTPSDLPPTDRTYAVSNAITLPTQAVFKGQENEFGYDVIDVASVRELERWLAAHGYVVPAPALSALAPYVGPGRRLLVAEVSSMQRVALTGSRRVELGGIRFWSRAPLAALPLTLGLHNSGGAQDVFVYVLDRKQRYQATNYDNALLPTNLAIDPGAASQLAGVYNALFEAAESRKRGVVTEYAWSTTGCGQPCPDAALRPDELLSFGGDVLEARTTSFKERAAAPVEESVQERRLFEERVRELPPAERARERAEHEAQRREIGKRLALAARQTYVLTRLHYRYDRPSLPRDLELGPAASPLRGGVGVPSGRDGALARASAPAAENELQSRFVARQPWRGEISCRAPVHFRWGKPWASEARASRAVSLALDLASAARDRSALDKVLRTPLPELGFPGTNYPAFRSVPSTPSPSPSAAPSPSACSFSAAARHDAAFGWLLIGALSALVRRSRFEIRRRLRSGIIDARAAGAAARRTCCTRHICVAAAGHARGCIRTAGHDDIRAARATRAAHAAAAPRSADRAAALVLCFGNRMARDDFSAKSNAWSIAPFQQTKAHRPGDATLRLPGTPNLDVVHPGSPAGYREELVR